VIIVLGGLMVFLGLLWWVLSLLLPDGIALVGTVVFGGAVVAVLAFVYLKSERFGKPEEREYSSRFRTVLREAGRAGRYEEIWAVTRRETAEQDMAQFIAAEEQGRLGQFIAEWDRALKLGREDDFFRERRQG
jgi:cbb3-type cytochrome oxidase subunit 3